MFCFVCLFAILVYFVIQRQLYNKKSSQPNKKKKAIMAASGDDSMFTKPIGVSVELLDILEGLVVDSVAGGLDSPTKDVVEQLVVPATAARKCSFADLYRHQTGPSGRPLIGPASSFVCHAWQYSFKNCLEVMRAYEAEEGHAGCYFWLDIAIFNQNKSVRRTHSWWSTTFKQCIAKCGSLLVVMSPWDAPLPLKRAWCLWEIMCAVDSPGCALEVRLPRSEEAKFEEEINSNFRGAMMSLVSAQAEEAEAWNPADKEMIFEAIENTCGFYSLNARVKEQMRTWFLKCGERMADNMKAEQGLTKDYGHLCFNLATMYKDFAFYDKSEFRFEECLAAKKAEYGEDAFQLAETYNNQAINFKKQGKNQKAMEAYEKSLRLKLRNPAVGPRHMKTATTYNNMGNIYKNRGDHQKAQDCYDRALHIRLEKLGPDHRECASTWNNMGDNYRLQGRNDEAMDCLQEALRIKLICPELGPNHPGTVTTFANLGKLFDTLGRVEDSLQMTNGCLKVRITTLGNHNHTESTMRGVIEFIQRMPGRDLQSREHALRELDYTLRLCESYRGPAHADTNKVREVISRIKSGA